MAVLSLTCLRDILQPTDIELLHLDLCKFENEFHNDGSAMTIDLALKIFSLVLVTPFYLASAINLSLSVKLNSVG